MISVKANTISTLSNIAAIALGGIRGCAAEDREEAQLEGDESFETYMGRALMAPPAEVDAPFEALAKILAEGLMQVVFTLDSKRTDRDQRLEIIEALNGRPENDGAPSPFSFALGLIAVVRAGLSSSSRSERRAFERLAGSYAPLLRGLQVKPELAEAAADLADNQAGRIAAGFRLLASKTPEPRACGDG